jgi:hypothetical protein
MDRVRHHVFVTQDGDDPNVNVLECPDCQYRAIAVAPHLDDAGKLVPFSLDVLRDSDGTVGNERATMLERHQARVAAGEPYISHPFILGSFSSDPKSCPL